MTRSTHLLSTTRRTIRRQTTYLSIPSLVNGNSQSGQVLAVGENGMAQLGLKSAIDQRKNPQPVLLPESVIQIAAGPLHSVCLTDENTVYTFGCNDEHALGRPDNADEDDDPFGEVDLSKVMDTDDENIIQIVAGDSHTLVLSDAGKVYGRSDRFVLDHMYYLILFFDCFTLGHISFEYKWNLWSCSKGKNGQTSKENHSARKSRQISQWK